eukprot:212405-Rhodomonas_salina.2
MEEAADMEQHARGASISLPAAACPASALVDLFLSSQDSTSQENSASQVKQPALCLCARASQEANPRVSGS